MKPMDTLDQELIDLLRDVQDVQARAVLQYQPVVDDILRTGSRDAEHIERTLSGLLDFCAHEPALALYKALCRHYWHIDAAATAYYIEAYREMWDSEETGSWSARRSQTVYRLQGHSPELVESCARTLESPAHQDGPSRSGQSQFDRA
jgi:hypothetical protein